MLLTDPERDAVAAAIADAESRTAGEIVVIVSSEAHHYPATALTVAALAAFALPLGAVLLGWAPDHLFPTWDAADQSQHAARVVEAFVAVQALLFAAVLVLVHYAHLSRPLTPLGLRRDRVHRDALIQFKARNLDHTTGRTGVLIYVAEAERIAEVVADTGIFAKVSPDHWGATVAAVIDGIKAGAAGRGLAAAVGLAGAVLAEHFPVAADDVNELPDRVIEI